MKLRNLYQSLALFVFATLAFAAFSPKAVAAPYCLTDVFGYVWNLNVTPAGGNVFNFSGNCVGPFGSPAPVTGTYNRTTNTVILTATNPAPDGCVTLSGSFTYTGSRTGSTLNFSWTNDCGGTGTGSGTVSKGACRIGNFASAPQPPAMGRAIILSDLQASPNPAQDMLTLTYTLTQTEDLNLRVLDMTGRTVATLASGLQQAGTYNLTWNLKNDAGSDLPNGIYLLEGNNRTERIMIQR
ncbi:MAG: T9SS type A sorting domain-containing protein [Bacteroidetes bacterium]|nr:T9SS type A sorting domain-containing protein [Bacteroidota bacterium]